LSSIACIIRLSSSIKLRESREHDKREIERVGGSRNQSELEGNEVKTGVRLVRLEREISS
jgi:hypothetical protein